MSKDRELEEIKQRMLERIMKPPSKSNILQDGVVNILIDANFDQAVASATLPLLVDFWADWCMPCKSMTPVVEAMARDHSGRAYFAKINTDQNRATQARFRVMSIPNFIIFKDGKQVDQVLGAVGRPGLETVLSRHTSKKNIIRAHDSRLIED
jgi:thioredoxin 1